MRDRKGTSIEGITKNLGCLELIFQDLRVSTLGYGKKNVRNTC
jgi:hypothetical protein